METPVKNGVTDETPNSKEPNTKINHDVPTKKNKDSRKIDDKSVEQVLKALNSLQTPEEKLAAMCKKYTEIVDENRKFQANSKQWEKKYVLTHREKEQLQLEYNRTILLKVKLESLCRELQKQNKSVKDESLLKIREEEERRKETQAKFQTTLSEITTLMQQNNEKNSKLRDDNLDMTKKFKSVVEQYELREQQVDKMAKQMCLENQLNEAKLNKASLEAQGERERFLTEKKQLLTELTQYQSRVTEMQNTEAALRCQISMYTDKYDEFQNALTKSNEVFGGFKEEMEKMSKKILKLEKETAVWKQRWEKSHTALLDMAAEKQQRDASLALQSRQFLQLQRLCRTMQAERRQLITTLQEHNIERPPLSQLPPEPEISIDSVDKVDAMAVNCAQLKQSLSQLQGQLSALTTKNIGLEENISSITADQATEAAATTPAQKNKKKGKGKKSKQAEQAKVEEVIVDDCIPPTEPLTIEEIPNDPEPTAHMEVTPESCNVEAVQMSVVESALESTPEPATQSAPESVLESPPVSDPPEIESTPSDQPSEVLKEEISEIAPVATDSITETKECITQDTTAPVIVSPVTETPVESPISVPVTNGGLSSPVTIKAPASITSPMPKSKSHKKNSKAAKQGKVSPEIVLQPTL